ncbi:hypothetical protein FRB99_007092 [Tulasnella sp. 403]|nr:hypothetical protein FRB99_007092 [Tulasnella sp. 403]
MDVYTLTFTYPRPEQNPPPNISVADSPNDSPTIDAIHALCLSTMNSFPVNVNFWQPLPTGGTLGDDANGGQHARTFNFMISGAYSPVLAARGFIMRECPLTSRTSISVPRSEILDLPSPLSTPSIKSAVRRRLDEAAGQTQAHIAVVNSPLTALASAGPTALRNPTNATLPFPANPFPSTAALSANAVGSTAVSGPSLEPEPLCNFVMSGHPPGPNVAKVRLLVMMDELSGLHSEAIEVDIKLHPIIAGRKRATIQNIQEETATNIYLPEFIRAGGVNQGAAGVKRGDTAIWITGEFFGVQRARDMLYQVAHTKTKSVISRDCAILPRKLDWMLTERVEELRTIMSDHSTFLEFPPLGNQTSVVTVYSDERINIHRSIRAIMLLSPTWVFKAASHLSAQFYLLPTHFNLLLPASTINPTQVPPLLKHLVAGTGGTIEIVFRDNCFEFFGSENDIRRGVQLLGEVGVVKNFHHEIRFQLELANEHREFISGKKNGKINKIMQLTGCRIRFETMTAPAGPNPLSIPSSGNVQPANGSGRSIPPSPTRTSFVNPGPSGQVQMQPQMYLAPGFQPQQHKGPGSVISIQPPTPNPTSPTTPTSLSTPSPSQQFGPASQSPVSPQSAANSTAASITNFLITLSGSTLPETLQGLSMLMEELPAEISFHVPESYHKRIIGVGGRTIQKIMKKYGVFVKFFNSNAATGEAGARAPDGQDWAGGQDPRREDADGVTALALGDVEDNVVARTPCKNSINLENLKAAVLEMVNPKDKDYTVETVSIPRRYHRILIGEKSIFIKDIENKTGSKVRFPDKETASDIVTIYGPETQVHVAAARLLDHVPFEADMAIPNAPELASLCTSGDFAAFVERMKREHQVVIVPRIPPSSSNMTGRDTLRRTGVSPTPGHKSQSTSSTSSSSADDFATFKFRCQKSNSDLLATVKEQLESFLANKGIYVSGPPPAPTGVSPGSSFSMKGPLGSGMGLGLSTTVGNPMVAADFKHKRADSFADAFPHFNSKLLSTAGSDPHRLLNRRIRMATSSPDVKALFNSHSQSPSQVYKLPEHDEQDDAGFQAPSQEGNEYYPPPPRIRHAPSISFIPGYRTEETIKRGSDSRLQDKIKDQSRQRSLTNRAQSLDLTSLSRSDRLTAVRVPSPVDSTNPSSPTSASAVTLSFPSVNGPPMSNHTSQHYTHQNHYSFPNASYTGPSYHHQHHLSYSRPRTQVSLSSSSSSLSLSSAVEQPVNDPDAVDASVMDDVSRVISQIRLETLH